MGEDHPPLSMEDFKRYSDEIYNNYKFEGCLLDVPDFDEPLMPDGFVTPKLRCDTTGGVMNGAFLGKRRDWDKNAYKPGHAMRWMDGL